MRLYLISEGSTDIGFDVLVDEDSRRGAVRVLTRRVLEKHWGRSIEEWEIETDRLPRLHRGGGFQAKVREAIREGIRCNMTSVAIVIDRDRTHGNRRYDRLDQGRKEALDTPDLRAMAEHTSLGVAIECMEAWLLADEAGLSEACGRTIDRVPSPEGLDGKPHEADHPKQLLSDVLQPDQAADLLDRIAEESSLEIVEQRCPRGFERYADELRARTQ